MTIISKESLSLKRSSYLSNKREMFSCHVMLWAEPMTFWSNQKGLSQFFFRHLMVWIKKGGNAKLEFGAASTYHPRVGGGEEGRWSFIWTVCLRLGKQFCFCFVHNCTLASSDVLIVSKILFTFLYYSTKLGVSIWNFVAYLYSSLNFFKIFVIWRV